MRISSLYITDALVIAGFLHVSSRCFSWKHFQVGEGRPAYCFMFVSRESGNLLFMATALLSCNSVGITSAAVDPLWDTIFGEHDT